MSTWMILRTGALSSFTLCAYRHAGLSRDSPKMGPWPARHGGGTAGWGKRATMARGRREGVLIAGGGVAGCLAALAMARHRPEVPLLIVEERETFGGAGFHHYFDDELEEGAQGAGRRPRRRALAGLLRRLRRFQPQAEGGLRRPRRRRAAPGDGRDAGARTSTGSAPRSSRCARTRWCWTAARRSGPRARSTRAAPPICRSSISAMRRGWSGATASPRRTGSTGRC